MKVFLLIFLSVLGSKTMSQEVISIKYSAFTRGTSKEIEVTENGLISNRNGEIKKKIEGKATLNQCIELIKKLDLEKIPSLKAPSNSRASDGALHAEIEIKTKEKTYTSNSFDEGNPPKELVKLVNLINKENR